MRVQGWDPVLIVCQIISLQTIHYLTLSIITPPLLSLLTSPTTLLYSGGSSTVAHILDWREIAARPAISSNSFKDLGVEDAEEAWKKIRGAWSGGKRIGKVAIGKSVQKGKEKAMQVEKEVEVEKILAEEEESEDWDFGIDEGRGWILGFAWIIASAVDIAPLYHLVRRPTFILDFSLTLNFVHLILTTYHSKSFPTSIFYWVVQALGALMMITIAEQLCVKREMATDLSTSYGMDNTEETIPLQER